MSKLHDTENAIWTALQAEYSGMVTPMLCRVAAKAALAKTQPTLTVEEAVEVIERILMNRWQEAHSFENREAIANTILVALRDRGIEFRE